MATRDIEATLYNGRHTLVFKNGKHRYYIDGKPTQGVTTIMGKVLAKPGLMLWPLNMAMKHLEPLLPTITAADLEAAKDAPNKRRDAGADTGTLVHGLVEDMLRTNKLFRQYPLESDEVRAAAKGFQDWHGVRRPKAVAVEQVVYSHALNFAGTFDSILEIDGKNYLCDLKTTNASRDAPRGVYADYFIQLGGYYYAYEEQRQYELANGGTNLVEIHDLMVISCRKDGRVDAVSALSLGITPKFCLDLWTSTLSLHRGLTGIKSKLGVK